MGVTPSCVRPVSLESARKVNQQVVLTFKMILVDVNKQIFIARVQPLMSKLIRSNKCKLGL